MAIFYVNLYFPYHGHIVMPSIVDCVSSITVHIGLDMTSQCLSLVFCRICSSFIEISIPFRNRFVNRVKFICGRRSIQSYRYSQVSWTCIVMGGDWACQHLHCLSYLLDALGVFYSFCSCLHWMRRSALCKKVTIYWMGLQWIHPVQNMAAVQKAIYKLIMMTVMKICCFECWDRVS